MTIEETGGAYRARDLAPRFFCMCCYQYAKRGSGNCRLCSAPMVSVDEIEVIAELRQRAQLAWDRKVQRESVALGALPVLVGLTLAVILDLSGALSFPHHGYRDGMPHYAIFLASAAFCWLVEQRIYRAVLRRRGRKPLRDQTFDVGAADVPALLAMLSVAVDD